MSDERKIGEAAVRKATGKGWSAWLDILDQWGAREKSHQETAKLLEDAYGLGGWWAQTVTVRYEKERGLREKHQKPTGFEVSVSRSIACTPAEAWQAWTRARELNRWFGEKAHVNLRAGGRYNLGGGDVGIYRVIVPTRRLRFTWDNPAACPGTVVEVRFGARRTKQGVKTTVSVQHMKLPSSEAAEEIKEGWSWAMDSLRSYLETGERIRWKDWKETRGSNS